MIRRSIDGTSKKSLAIVLAVCMLIAVGVVAASAVNVGEGEHSPMTTAAACAMSSKMAFTKL